MTNDRSFTTTQRPTELQAVPPSAATLTDKQRLHANRRDRLTNEKGRQVEFLTAFVDCLGGAGVPNPSISIQRK
jgi:hypothetical protein